MKKKETFWEIIQKKITSITGFIESISKFLIALTALIGIVAGLKFCKNEHQDCNIDAILKINEKYSELSNQPSSKVKTDTKRELGTQLANMISEKCLNQVILEASKGVNYEGLCVGLTFRILKDSVNCKNKEIIYQTYHSVQSNFARYEYCKAIIKLINEKCITTKDSNIINQICYKFKIKTYDNDIFTKIKAIKMLLFPINISTTKLNDCPQTSPNGQPLENQSQYKLHQSKLNNIWIVGHYDNNCKWIAGTYEKVEINNINSCPQSPPDGYVENHSSNSNPNFEWVKGHWMIQDGECMWTPGSLSRKRSPN